MSTRPKAVQPKTWLGVPINVTSPANAQSGKPAPAAQSVLEQLAQMFGGKDKPKPAKPVVKKDKPLPKPIPVVNIPPVIEKPKVDEEEKIEPAKVQAPAVNMRPAPRQVLEDSKPTPSSQVETIRTTPNVEPESVVKPEEAQVEIVPEHVDVQDIPTDTLVLPAETTLSNEPIVSLSPPIVDTAPLPPLPADNGINSNADSSLSSNGTFSSSAKFALGFGIPLLAMFALLVLAFVYAKRRGSKSKALPSLESGKNPEPVNSWFASHGQQDQMKLKQVDQVDHDEFEIADRESVFLHESQIMDQLPLQEMEIEQYDEVMEPAVTSIYPSLVSVTDMEFVPPHQSFIEERDDNPLTAGDHSAPLNRNELYSQRISPNPLIRGSIISPDSLRYSQFSLYSTK